MSSEDEQRPTTGEKDEEIGMGTTSEASHNEREPAGKDPEDTVTARPWEFVDGRRMDLSRQATRAELPGVEQVLKRTVTLSGASAHGGG